MSARPSSRIASACAGAPREGIVQRGRHSARGATTGIVPAGRPLGVRGQTAVIDRVRGTIRRRILVNYRVDPDVIQRLLPSGFEPKLAGGYAIAGVCLIRLESERPAWLSAPIGINSENAAHRVAVYCGAPGARRESVYIARRDSASLLTRLAGGRALPWRTRTSAVLCWR